MPTARALPSAEARSERAAILDALHGVIHNDLTEKQGTALLAELRGMPQDEIARHLGSNRHAISKLTHDARKRLKLGLESAGFEAQDIRAAFAHEKPPISLSKSEIDDLMRLVGLTRNDEINGERCLALVAEFAERSLAGQSVPAGLEAVSHHLSVCAECREEYEALLRTLKAMDS